MPSSTLYQKRIASTMAQSTMKTSGVTDPGARSRGFAARTRALTIVGGDFTVASVVLNTIVATLLMGDTLQLTGTPKTTAGDTLADAVTWASSDEAVATVSATGLVTVVGSGTCNITGTAAAVDSAVPCAVTVTAILTQLILADATLSFAHTTTGTTTVTAKDQFGAAMTLPAGVAVASSNEAKATVALVSTTLTVTGVAAGTANVTASKNAVTSNTCAVTLS